MYTILSRKVTFNKANKETEVCNITAQVTKRSKEFQALKLQALSGNDFCLTGITKKKY